MEADVMEAVETAVAEMAMVTAARRAEEGPMADILGVERGVWVMMVGGMVAVESEVPLTAELKVETQWLWMTAMAERVNGTVAMGVGAQVAVMLVRAVEVTKQAMVDGMAAAVVDMLVARKVALKAGVPVEALWVVTLAEETTVVTMVMSVVATMVVALLVAAALVAEWVVEWVAVMAVRRVAAPMEEAMMEGAMLEEVMMEEVMMEEAMMK